MLSLRRTNRVFSMSRSSSHEFGMGFRTAHMTPGPDGSLDPFDDLNHLNEMKEVRT